MTYLIPAKSFSVMLCPHHRKIFRWMRFKTLFNLNCRTQPVFNISAAPACLAPPSNLVSLYNREFSLKFSLFFSFSIFFLKIGKFDPVLSLQTVRSAYVYSPSGSMYTQDTGQGLGLMITTGIFSHLFAAAFKTFCFKEGKC